MSPQHTVGPKIAERLQTTNTAGLADTLAALAGRSTFLENLPSGPRSTILGMMVNDSTIAVDRQLPQPLFTETLIHEFGHILGQNKNSQLPFLTEAHEGGRRTPRAESAARDFERAMIALRETAVDTSFALPLIGALASGSRFSRRGETPISENSSPQPGTFRAVLELLALPMFENHPLRSRMSELTKAFDLDKP